MDAWHARAVWDRLLTAGEPHGITPYGTETMHVLRAEKGYPIVGLDDPKQIVPFVRKLEEVLIRSVAEFGVEAWREDGFTGVWTAKGKVAAIGVRVVGGFTAGRHAVWGWRQW